MGSSKKNKDKDRTREVKKKRKHGHRERSKSRDPEKERHKHRHRHHHKHKRRHSKRSRGDQPTSPSNQLTPRSRSGSLSDITISDDENSPKQFNQVDDSVPPPPPRIAPHRSPKYDPSTDYPDQPPTNQHNSDASLSISETNKIRMKLGLKPLQLSEAPKLDVDSQQEDIIRKDSYGEFYHKPAENIRDKLQVEKLREKIAAQRERRKQKEKLHKVKNLGESDDEDDALAWVVKSRKLHKQKLEAEKKNKMLEELDAQFGIGDLVDEEIKDVKRKSYVAGSLSGLKVQHDMSRFDNGNTTILTLKDSDILEGEEDTLVNVNIVDIERDQRNLKRKLARPDDKEYDAPEVDEYGKIVQSNVLSKYDEEINEGPKESSFRLGDRGRVMMERQEPVSKMARLRQMESLTTADSQLASEYMTRDEMVSFRKVKKKKKKKKMLTADDLKPLGDEDEDNSSRHDRFATNESSHFNNPSRVKTLKELMEDEPLNQEQMEVDDDDIEAANEASSEAILDNLELEEALNRTRRAKASQRIMPSTEIISNFIRSSKPPPQTPETFSLDMTLNTTDEFCRTLGDIPTYGLAGNRTEDDAAMLQMTSPKKGDQGDARGAWEEVDIQDTRVEITDDMALPILEEEPDASKGVSNALKLARKKGYLEKDNSNKSGNAGLLHLRAIHYSIEDKAVDDDRRGRGHDRYQGPVSDFREKDNYKPDVKLEYVDDEGRKLCSKEAFRYLSHKFHGKGSGKNKLEKRMKKWQEDLLMKTMSSSDTPLQTLERQREKQKQLGTAYIVLSGNKTQEAMDVKK